MADYLAPGVYVEPLATPKVLSANDSMTTGGFIGITVRGVMKIPVVVTSWTDFLNKFAYGIDSPFMANSDLAYSVYGFFQNGGTRCYVIRTAHSDAAKSVLTVTGTSGAVFNAKDEGTWGNGLKMVITANVDVPTLFDVVVSLSDEIVESYVGLSNDSSNSRYFMQIINDTSNFITAVSGTLIVMASTSFATGADGISAIVDADYIECLALLDTVDDINMLCVPGQVTINSDIIAYAATRKDIYILLDAPKASTVVEVKTLRKTLNSDQGSINYPWIRVTDPLSSTGKLRDCPTCGHVMGEFARSIAARGQWKAPAGTEAVLKGAVEVVKILKSQDLSTLNSIGVCPIIVKNGYGIVVWGARSLSNDPKLLYVSDVLLDIYVNKTLFNLTQFAVFEVNGEMLWTRITAVEQDFYDTLWRKGALKGATAAEAYFVKCDGEVNNDTVTDAGKVISQSGYSNKKPAEFVIVQTSHTLASN